MKKIDLAGQEEAFLVAYERIMAREPKPTPPPVIIKSKPMPSPMMVDVLV